jgi:hypothetical protein
MRSLVNILERNYFSVAEQTARMRRIKNNPRLISKSGLFASKYIKTIVFDIQLDEIKQQIVLATARGAAGNTTQYNPSKSRQLRTLYYPVEDQILADDIYTTGHLATGNDIATMATIQQLLTEKQQQALRNFDATWEWQRVCALQGIVKNIPDISKGQTDTSVLYSLWDMFGITEQNIDFEFYNPNLPVEAICASVHDYLDNNGGVERTETLAFCSPEFYDALVTHPVVRAAYQRKQEGQFLWEYQRQFVYQDIKWIRYGGYAYPGAPWIPSGTVRFALSGIPDLYQTVFSPADFVESVGKPGQEFYFMNWARNDSRGINTLAVTTATSLCTMPQLLLKATAILDDPNP